MAHQGSRLRPRGLEAPDFARITADAQMRMALNALRIFPLPDAVLLPGALIPLHIFEPRYREMLADCRQDTGVLAIATLRPDLAQDDGRAPIWPFVGVGGLVFDQVLPDHRSIIVVKGILRARVVQELETDLPYRVVRAVPLPDYPETTQAREGQLELLRHLVGHVAQLLGAEGDADEILDVCATEGDPGWLADVVAGALIADPHTRLQLLGQRAPLERLDAVNAYLAEALKRAGCSGRGSN